MTNSGNEYFNQIMRDVKITDVLEKLGFYLVRRGVNYNTLCPFHHDKNPSLVIYENTYHCFACGAHGNIFSIIKKIKVCTFYEAVIWLESEYPGIKRYKQNILPALTKIVPSAFNLALDCYKEMSKEEKEEYQEFCNQRKFSTEFLSSAEVFYVKGRKLLNSVKNDIEKKNLLQEKKLLKEKAANNIFSGHTGYKDAFLEDTFTDDTFILEDTFIKDRVIFTLRDYNNQIVGFAGRATSEDKPKYLFTKDLPKSSFLYRLNVIKQNILKNDKKDICKICITEGVFDSLRFNSLKLEEKEYYAVSVLGSHITKDQVKTLETFVNEISAMGKTVEIILFLDSDNAGIKGTFTSIKNLWGRQTFRQLSLSVIINKQIFNNNSSSNNSNNSNDYNSSYSNNSDYNVSLENEKEDRNKNVNNFKDPDEILKSLNNENQHIWLEKNNLNVFEFLIRYISDQELLLFDTESDNENDTDSGKYIKKILSEMNTIYRINVLDKIRRLLSNKEWEEILAFYETIYTGELENEFGFNLISKYILLKIDTINSQKQKSQKHIPTTSEEDLFNRAILIARDSYLREELHLDDFTWDRIQYCADAFIPYFSSIIDPKNKNYKSYENMKIPMFSAKIPKNSDEFRLKALYSHEQLILQQYVLNELLRTDDNNRNFEECIPAVRYDKLSNTVYTTGASYHDFYKNLKISAVSFAYQINMQGVNGAITGEGMFRPFYECWKSFIKYIEEGINKIEGDKIYKVRLDIRKYYDKIPLHAVRRVLITQLKEAPWTTSNRCKPFIEKSDDVEDIAIKVADWINREVFNYKYFCPKTDIVKDSENGLYGIPQGPNISAYLANIVLFPLDKKITEYVNAENKKIIEGEQNDIAENRIAVRYARYVDDMVIVSEKPEHLIKIRNIIIDELQGIDLELSTKTDEAEAINKSEAYDWLTDERGGLCVSSVDDFPEDSIESAMEKYEDFDELNRRNALMFLYNSLFDFDNIDNSDIAKIIEKLFATEELRYSDAIKLAELLIMHVIKINYDDNLKDNLKDNSKNDLADIDLFYEFNKLFNREIKKAPGDSILHREGIAYMAFLDGLIKILNPKNLYKTKIGESFVNQKIIQYIMRYINKYSILPEHCYINEENVETNKEVLKENIIFIKTKILQIIGLSIRLSKESFAEVIYEKFLFKIIAQCKNEYVLRWIYSVFSDMRYDNKMGESFMSNLKDFHKYKQNQESLQRFHYVTTRLYSCRTKDDFYDLKKLYNDIKVKAGTNTEFEEYDILEKCMLLWLESEEFAKTEVNYNHHDNNDNDNDNSNNYDNDDDNSDNNNDGDSKNKSRISYDYTKKVALKTFLNIFIDKSILSDVIIKNNKLLCTLFSDINESLRYLPVPPGVSYNGVFAIDKGNDIAKRADLIDNIPDKIADLDWEEEQNLNQNCWIKKAYFKNWKNISEYFEEYLEEKNYKQRSKLPEKIADIHNKLTKFLSHEDNKMIILSKHHTFIDENGEMRVLSYKVNNKQLDNCIAISNGSNSLKISYVTQFGSLFWKVGNLLFDALKLNEIITDKTEKNENVNKNGNEDKDEDKDKDKYDYITPMLHNSFYRLNGEYLSKTKIKNEKSYTQTVKRVLKLFEKFPSEKKDQHLFLIDSKLINNFITYRQNMDNIIIDSASYHLNKWSNTYIGYYYDDFLKIFPEEKEAQNYERLIKRRTSYAYFSIAKKLNEIITTRNKSCKLIDHELIGIEALCCGLYICSIAENLRMQVLERIISFDQDESQALLSKEFPLEFLGVSVIDIEKNNVVFLMDSEDQMKQLKDIAKYLLMKKSTGAIKDITLEGWFLLLCWVLEIGTEGNYVTSNRIYRKDEKDLKNINSVTEEIRSKIFITDKFMPQDQENKENKENEYPFEGFFKTISDWNGEYTQKIFEKLNQIDNLDNVIIQKKASIFFSKSIEKHSQYSQELRINLVSMNLDGQNISNMPSFFLTDGHIGKLMRTEEKDEENKVIWTETRIKNKIAGVSLISDKLSNLAASKKIKYDNTSAYEHTNDEISDKIKVAVSESENYSYYKDEKSVETCLPEKENNVEHVQDKIECKNDNIKSKPKQNKDKCRQDQEKCKQDYNEDYFEEILKNIDYIQKDNWSKRKKTAMTVDRIALFQFDVDDSYRHPISEMCLYCFDKDGDCYQKKGYKEGDSYQKESYEKAMDLKANPAAWNKDNLEIENNNLSSCAEFRRRKLLEKTFEVCHLFDVEIILLPEYSVRPETVEWMLAEITGKGYKFSVWAGTFRIVPHHVVTNKEYNIYANIHDWAAVLPIICNTINENSIGKNDDLDKPKIIFKKFKKYPSISLQEVINPSPSEGHVFEPVLKTLFKSKNEILFGDARDDVIELICSEMFLMASPSNIIPFARASYNLGKRFGGYNKSFDEFLIRTMQDIKNFGKSTTIYNEEGKYNRTPIILVPAYTTRAVDYYLAGQASYLSSGLTTVFCNAVGPNTEGGSCFIGTDCWDNRNGSKDVYMPDYLPYHGITPGIYEQFIQHKDRGGLGKEEQALLICDINPSFSFKGKPNPQSLGKCLELVAHIPVIESYKSKSTKLFDKEIKKYKCRCTTAEKRVIKCRRCLSCADNKNCSYCDAAVIGIIDLYEKYLQSKASGFADKYKIDDKELYRSTAEDDNPSIVKDALKSIGTAIGSEWLIRRGDVYEKQHINNPQKWPSQTALDWIWVDVDYTDEYKKGDYKINIPIYSNIHTK